MDLLRYNYCTGIYRYNLLRVQFTLPPKFEHFAADVSQSNESCTPEYELTRSVPANYIHGQDTLSSAILIMFY